MDCFSYYNNNSSTASSLETFVKQKKGNNTNGKKSSKELKLSTDPQSVAARARRHRITDRFKILQSLVPGGAKMDTVSMLDEAIHYIEFLKAQIWIHQAMINFVDDVIIDPSSLSFSDQQSGLYSPESVVAGGEVDLSTPSGLPQFYFRGGEAKGFD